MSLSDPRPSALAVAALAGLGAVGATIMSIAHFGVDVPFAPGPGRLLLPVAIGFAIGAVLFVVVAVGVARRERWSWPLALGVNALTFVSAAMPFRGWPSAVAIVVTAVAIMILLAPGGRALRSQ